MSEQKIKTQRLFKLDTSKIETIEDVRQVLDGMNIQMTDAHENFEDLEEYLTRIK